VSRFWKRKGFLIETCFLSDERSERFSLLLFDILGGGLGILGFILLVDLFVEIVTYDIMMISLL